MTERAPYTWRHQRPTQFPQPVEGDRLFSLSQMQEFHRTNFDPSKSAPKVAMRGERGPAGPNPKLGLGLVQHPEHGEIGSLGTISKTLGRSLTGMRSRSGFPAPVQHQGQHLYQVDKVLDFITTQPDRRGEANKRRTKNA